MWKRVPEDRKLNQSEITQIGKSTSHLSEIIVLACSMLNWTQEELSFRSDVSTTTISRIKNNKTNPRLNTISKLAEAFGCPVSMLLGISREISNISEILKNYRKKHALTQKKLAQRVGMSLSTIKYYEKGVCNARLYSPHLKSCKNSVV